MNINTMQDIIDNIELLKQREITYYEGHWCCFKVDQNGCGSVDNDIRLNDKLFNGLSFYEVKRQIKIYDFTNLEELLLFIDTLKKKEKVLDEYRPTNINKKNIKK